MKKRQRNKVLNVKGIRFMNDILIYLKVKINPDAGGMYNELLPRD